MVFAGALLPGGRGGQHVLHNACTRREGDENRSRCDRDAEEDGRLSERGRRHHHATAQGAHREARGGADPRHRPESEGRGLF